MVPGWCLLFVVLLFLFYAGDDCELCKCDGGKQWIGGYWDGGVHLRS
jgi:hypothetical protein